MVTISGIAADEAGERVRALSRADLREFLRAAQREPYYELILFLALTGVRLDEALSLRWSDVNLDTRLATIRRSAQDSDPMPESCVGPRTIDVAKPLASALAKLHEGRAEHERVFARRSESTDGYVDQRQRQLTATFQRVSKRAALPDVDPPTLRHTWATTMLEAGAPLAYVSRALGHHSTAFTAAVYVPAAVEPGTIEAEALVATGKGEATLRRTLGASWRSVFRDP